MRSLQLLVLLGAFVAATTLAAERLDDFDALDEEEEELLAPPPAEQAPVEDIKVDTKPYKAPSAPSVTPFVMETFQSGGLGVWKKVEGEKFKGEWGVLPRDMNWVEGDEGLKMLSDSAFHGIARELTHEFKAAESKSLYGSMEVQFEKMHNCGGAYFKLFDKKKTDGDVAKFNETTDYSIMFGPDQCGFMVNKVHLIVKYNNPKGGEDLVEEHLETNVKIPSDKPKLATQFGFSLHADGGVQLFVNGNEAFASSKFKDAFKNKFANAETIADSSATKPADWVNESEISDPAATKPEDWDEEAPAMIVDEDAVMPDGWLEEGVQMVPNPDATKPEDWDDEDDGEWIRPVMRNPECAVGCGKWTPPLKENPEYKGVWVAPKIPNPAYKGVWEPPTIPNPDHYDIENPWSVINNFNAIGFELWTVEGGAVFDNILVTTNEADYLKFVEETYGYKADLAVANWAKLEQQASQQGVKAKIDVEPTSMIGKMYARFTRMTQGQSAPVVALAMGLPIACIGYLLNRFLRKVAKSAVVDTQLKKTDVPTNTSASIDPPAAAEESASDENQHDGEANKETEPTAPTSAEPIEQVVKKRKGSNPTKAKATAAAATSAN